MSEARIWRVAGHSSACAGSLDGSSGFELVPAMANSARSTLSISLNHSIARSALLRFGNFLAASATSWLVGARADDAAWQMLPAKIANGSITTAHVHDT